jgi:tRNA U34 5-carboxymethylaminomethyl modifying GTPase MnmE/TrmE
MKYILIENNEPEQGCTVTIFDTAGQRDRATIKAIYADGMSAANELEAQADLEELRVSGELNFEGDPGLRWIDACEVKHKRK